MIPARRGVALIIAISVLAALLLLALPFVFSQTASMAGARSAAYDGVARRGADRAAGNAIALGVMATGLHRSRDYATAMSAAVQTYVQVPLQINDAAGPIRAPSYIDNSWRLVLESGADWTTAAGSLVPKLDGPTAVHGAVIEDESRRLDPNTLGERGWAIVLKRAGIKDPTTVAWTWSGGNTMLPSSDPLHHGRWETGLLYGRLANRLADWRPANSGRFNRLEDLLGADPDETVSDPPAPYTLGCTPIHPPSHDRVTGQPVWPPALGTTWQAARAAIEATRNRNEGDSGQPDSDGYRIAPLTQSELEKLRPFISFLLPGQGRSGLIDLGTVVKTAPTGNGWSGVTTDDLSPDSMGVGLDVRMHNSSRVRAYGAGIVRSGRYLDNGLASDGDALGMEAAPSLNINTVPSTSGLVELFTRANPPPGWPADPATAPINSIGMLGRLFWLDGRLGNSATDSNDWFERPALGIWGFGILAIEGAATALDQQGDATAQRRRRTVVQAVPQERVLEVAWRTQGELEALIRARHGSWMMAGPHPTNRIADWGSVAGDMAALDGAGWLEPAPVCSFGRNPVVSFDWRVPLGLTGAQSWNDVLKMVNGSAVVADSGPVSPPNLRASGVSVGALTAQGLRLSGSDVLAYECTARNGVDVGPLRFAGNFRDELGSRQLSMRFALPTSPSGPVILAEVRNQRDPLLYDYSVHPPVAAAAAGQAAAERTNLWRIEYRPGPPGYLVLVLANAALPWSPDDRTRVLASQDWQAGFDMPEAAEDARCLPDAPGAKPFAPADPAVRVEFRYALPNGLEAGRWYHLQAYCAADRPGTHGLILDGIVGRDGTRPGVDMQQLGDHYTWPSLRLDGGAAIPKVDPAATGGDALVGNPASVAVTYPSDLNLAGILPERGTIRIDDEYFSYSGRTGTAGTGSITGLQRARRVNTNQAGTSNDPADVTPPFDQIPDSLLRWPVTQAHAGGTLVTPGWAQVTSLSGRWLRGRAVTRQAFQPAVVSGAVTAGLLSGTNVGYRLPSTGGPMTVAAGPHPWPARGLVRFVLPSAADATAAFTANGSTLTLEWGGPGVSAAPPDDLPSDLATAILISLEVDGDVTNTATRLLWADGSPVQLLDPTTGRCEWILSDGRVDRDAVAGLTVAGRYLTRSDGWDMTAYPSPRPISQPRGNSRTPWRQAAPWPSGTVVLPVQTAFDLDRLEAGDVLTVVPQDITLGTQEPTQLLVRYAARDAFPLDPASSTLATGVQFDTINERFALAHAVPDTLPDPNPLNAPAVPQMALIGRGWAGDDLSQIGNNRPRRGALPRAALLAAAGSVPKMHLGCGDPRSGVTADVLIDDLCAGPLTGSLNANTQTGCEVLEIDGLATGSIADTAAALPVTIGTSAPVFTQIGGSTYGLVRLDGEVFAYRRISDTSATLIARALLGSQAQVHNLSPGPDTLVGPAGSQRAVRSGLTITRLPMGPVGELASNLAAADHGTAIDVVELPYADYYRDPPAAGFHNAYEDLYAPNRGNQRLWSAPCIVVHHPSDTSIPAEAMRLLDYPTQANQRMPCRWLRGLYGTDVRQWDAPFTPGTRPSSWTPQETTPFPVQLTVPQTALNPIVIGWWPRFAPVVPDSLPNGDEAAILRSRSYTWAGFPMRMYGARFDPAIAALSNGGVADVPEVPIPGAHAATVRVLAAGTGTGQLFDWDRAPHSSAGSGLTTPFAWQRFQGREVDGAEMRVHATGSSSGAGLAALADQQGRVMRLGATDAEATAVPTDTGPTPPAVLPGIRLRCVAPTRVLAVEEVR